jgi:hypothetical protein
MATTPRLILTAPQACYPCRQRKVKCDQSVPCKTCVVREHPELCTYHPPSESHPPAKRISMGLGMGQSNGHDFSNGMVHIHGGTVTLPREVRITSDDAEGESAD